MSQENAEVVQGALSAFNTGPDTPAFDEHWTEDCEFVSITAGQIEGGTYRGHEGLRRYAEDRSDAWAELRFEVDESIDAEDQVAVVGTLVGRGRGSGVQVDQRIAVVCRLRAGKIASAHAFPDVQQALQAAGLRE